MESYYERQKESGFKIGDRVRVIKIVEDYTDGWKNTWVPQMSKRVGKEGTICNIGSFDEGIVIEWHENEYFSYPYFVLEKIHDSPKAKVDRWNSKCPKCGSDAYQGLHLIECSRRCDE